MTMKKMHTLVVGDDEFDVVDDELTERVETLEDDLEGMLDPVDISEDFISDFGDIECTIDQITAVKVGHLINFYFYLNPFTLPESGSVILQINPNYAPMKNSMVTGFDSAADILWQQLINTDGEMDLQRYTETCLIYGTYFCV